MNSEQMTVLQMLSDGKINAAEAERLLIALIGHSLPGRQRTVPHRDARDRITFMPTEVPAWNLPVQM